MSGTAHVVFKNDSLSVECHEARTATRRRSSTRISIQAGFTLGGPIVQRQALLLHGVRFPERATRRSRPTRRASSRRVVAAFAALGSPNENGSDRAHERRARLPRQDRLDRHRRATCVTLRYNYTWSEQKNGTFDVDSWGRSANAIEKDFSHAVTGSLISTLQQQPAQRVPLPVRARRSSAPVQRPDHHGRQRQNRPLPDTAFDFGSTYRFGMPFFIPVEYYDTRIQFNDNVSFLRGAHSIKAGAEYNRVNSVQTFLGFANGRYIFDSTAGFLEDLANHTNNHVLLYLQQAGVGNISVEEAGTQSIPQTEPAVFIQDAWQATPNLNVQYGLRWEAQIQPDPITDPR